MNDLVEKGVAVHIDGKVTGTLKYVQGWEWFSGVKAEQSGNYLPLKLGKNYDGKPVTVQRKGGKAKTETDTEWIIRIPSNDTSYTIKAQGVEDLTLTFAGTTLKKQ